MQTQQVVKAAGDVTAYGTVVATIIGWLPSIAALLSIIWFTIQITEKIVGKPFHEFCVCKRFWAAARRVWDKLRS